MLTKKFLKKKFMWKNVQKEEKKTEGLKGLVL